MTKTQPTEHKTYLKECNNNPCICHSILKEAAKEGFAEQERKYGTKPDTGWEHEWLHLKAKYYPSRPSGHNYLSKQECRDIEHLIQTARTQAENDTANKIIEAFGAIAVFGQEELHDYQLLAKAVKECVIADERARIVEMVRELKYTDTRRNNNHPEIKWTDCEACTENYHWNAALEAILKALSEVK